MTIESLNPATGEVLERFKEYSEAEVETKLQQSAEAYLVWKDRSFESRSDLMRKVAELLRRNAREYAEIITLEMGKPIMQSLAEVEKCAAVSDFYAEHAQGFLSKRQVKTEAADSYVRYDPIGAVLAIMPWNFPLWQVFRFLAPSLMAGNVGLLKHASNVPRSALLIEKVLLEAGFPEGVFTTLLISTAATADVIRDERVRAVTLTGSEGAGKAVASTAGSVLKKCVLELGGSDAFIVLEDANVEAAAKMAATSRMINVGQSCIAAKRFIVHEAVSEEFTGLFKGHLEAMKLGDPMDEDVEIGPMARVDLRNELHGQVQASIEEGAQLLLGGKLPKGPGAYYPATLLAGVKPGMTIFDEETFGPVAPVIVVSSTEEAITTANLSRFGLGGALWTADLEKAGALAARIESGAVFINGMTISDPRMPFGGVKDSGYGRELSEEGIREFTNVKSVVVR